MHRCRFVNLFAGQYTESDANRSRAGPLKQRFVSPTEDASFVRTDGGTVVHVDNAIVNRTDYGTIIRTDESDYRGQMPHGIVLLGGAQAWILCKLHQLLYMGACASNRIATEAM